MKWRDLTKEQKLAYVSAFHTAERNYIDAVSQLRHFITGVLAGIESHELRSACYQLDFALPELEYKLQAIANWFEERGSDVS
jgi:hypothetical protein